MLIDFKEIECPTKGDNPDLFELFARDFLNLIGYNIISEPSRGADGGIDIKVEQIRINDLGQEQSFYWLVSCKHHAHSGKSVRPIDEINIIERLEQHTCTGFIGFYSTIPSQGLTTRCNSLAERGYSMSIYDRQKIEKEIIGYQSMETLFLRYFPMSYEKWKKLYYYTEPVSLFNYYISNRFERKQVLYPNNFSKKSDVIISQIDVFQNAIGDSEQLLKALKNTRTFEEFMQYKSIKLIVDKELDEWIFHVDSDIDKDPKYIDLTISEKLDISRSLHIEKLSLKHNFEIKGEFLLRGSLFPNSPYYDINGEYQKGFDGFGSTSFTLM